MNQSLIEIMMEAQQTLGEDWEKQMEGYREQYRLQYLSDEMYRSTNERFFKLIFDRFSSVQEREFEGIQQFAKEQIQMGWPLQYLTKGLQIFKQVVLTHIHSQEALTFRYDQYDQVEGVINPVIDLLIEEYSVSWEKSHQLQRLALKELTAPLIPVMENISVMPIVGTIDTERAKLIMENLLSGVIKYESHVVLIDITGVPIVDTMVAHHLIQVSDAVRLVGAECILVGIRPEIAQTIVNLGIQLNKVKTTSSLLRGIKQALSMTGRAIMELESNEVIEDE